MAEDNPKQPTEAEAAEITAAVEAAMAAATGEGEEPIEASTESADAAPQDLEAELAAAQDAALRAQADAMNVQRRSEQEIDKARKFALERFCGDLLGVVDNLERAMESSSDAGGDAALIEGIELTHKGFMDVLTKYGVVPVDPMGEPYDPETAQAMSMVAQPDAEPNTVVAVMQKGYTLNGRLLRPAMVMVSKAASGQ